MTDFIKDMDFPFSNSSIGYFYLPIRSCLTKMITIWFYQSKTFGQVFTAFGQLKHWLPVRLDKLVKK